MVFGHRKTKARDWFPKNYPVATPATAVDKLHAFIGDKIEDFSPTLENAKQRLFIEAWRQGQ